MPKPLRRGSQPRRGSAYSAPGAGKKTLPVGTPADVVGLLDNARSAFASAINAGQATIDSVAQNGIQVRLELGCGPSDVHAVKLPLLLCLCLVLLSIVRSLGGWRASVSASATDDDGKMFPLSRLLGQQRHAPSVWVRSVLAERRRARQTFRIATATWP